MGESGDIKEKISKSLENPLLNVVKNKDLSTAITDDSHKKKYPQNQISPSLEKYEKRLKKERTIQEK